MRRATVFCIMAVVVVILLIVVGASQPTPRVAWSNIHAVFDIKVTETSKQTVVKTKELWWKTRNVWRLTDLNDGSVVVADGTFMYSDFDDFAAGTPLDPKRNFAPADYMTDAHVSWVLAQAREEGPVTILGRECTIYRLHSSGGHVVTTYWLDNKTMFPLRVEETRDGNVYIVLEVTQFEERAPAEELLRIPEHVRRERFLDPKRK